MSSAAEAAHKELIPEHPVSAMVNPLLERSGSSVVKLPSERTNPFMVKTELPDSDSSNLFVRGEDNDLSSDQARGEFCGSLTHDGSLIYPQTLSNSNKPMRTQASRTQESPLSLTSQIARPSTTMSYTNLCLRQKLIPSFCMAFTSKNRFPERNWEWQIDYSEYSDSKAGPIACGAF